MTKKIIEKITSGGVLNVNDLNPSEKKALYAHFSAYGMSQSTCYLRFFDKGFRQWEIIGISHIRQEFLLTHNCCVDDKGTEDEGSRGYGYVLTLTDGYDDSKFYSVVSDLKMGVKLSEFMAERGMASQMTVRTRFKANDWKAWELKGIKAILEELYAE